MMAGDGAPFAAHGPLINLAYNYQRGPRSVYILCARVSDRDSPTPVRRRWELPIERDRVLFSVGYSGRFSGLVLEEARMGLG